MKLKNTIKMLRKRKGWTQSELAKLMKVQQYNISEYETGRVEPNIATLIQFADVFHVSVDYLLGRKRKKDDIEREEELDNSFSEMAHDPFIYEVYAKTKDLTPYQKGKINTSISYLIDIFQINNSDNEE